MAPSDLQPFDVRALLGVRVFASSVRVDKGGALLFPPLSSFSHAEVTGARGLRLTLAPVMASGDLNHRRRFTIDVCSGRSTGAGSVHVLWALDHIRLLRLYYLNPSLADAWWLPLLSEGQRAVVDRELASAGLALPSGSLGAGAAEREVA